jgi:hypothetical protein
LMSSYKSIFVSKNEILGVKPMKGKQSLKDFIRKMTKNSITDEEWFVLLKSMYEPGIIEQFVEEGGIGGLMHLLGEKVTVK